MITKKTVLILGAGASMHLRFPSGPDLVNRIITKYRRPANIDLNFLDAVSETCSLDQNDIYEFAHELSRSATYSIDEFLEYREEYRVLGKLAIASVLIPFENPDVLFGVEDTDNWYKYLFSKLDTTFEEFHENNLSILTFNYDRSLEVYLFNALKHKYGKNDKEVYEQFKSLKIIHLHGQLGKLNWTSNNGNAYSSKLTRDSLVNRANNIQIIHESDIEKNPQFEEAKAELANAELILFLGFGYHPLNMKRLGFSRNRSPIQTLGNYNIAGTAFGLTELEIREFKGQYTHFYRNRIFSPMKILPFLREKVSFN